MYICTCIYIYVCVCMENISTYTCMCDFPCACDFLGLIGRALVVLSFPLFPPPKSKLEESSAKIREELEAMRSHMDDTKDQMRFS